MLSFAAAAWAGPTLDKVRVFYRNDGSFLADLIWNGKTPASKPEWAVGYCDIPGQKWDPKAMPKGRVRVRPDTCTFYQAEPTKKEKEEQRMQSLGDKWRAGTITAEEKDELLKWLVLRYLDDIKPR